MVRVYALSDRSDSRKKAYTKGELNRLIDSLVHPLAKQNSRLLIVGGFLHALVERDPASLSQEIPDM